YQRGIVWSVIKLAHTCQCLRLGIRGLHTLAIRRSRTSCREASSACTASAWPGRFITSDRVASASSSAISFVMAFRNARPFSASGRRVVLLLDLSFFRDDRTARYCSRRWASAWQRFSSGQGPRLVELRNQLHTSAAVMEASVPCAINDLSARF